MKWYVKASSDRQYDVAIYLKGMHGPIGDKMVQHWALSSNSAENAKWFAVDILEGMTVEEIFEDSNLPQSQIDKVVNKYNLDYNNRIDYDLIPKIFNFDIFRIY